MNSRSIVVFLRRSIHTFQPLTCPFPFPFPLPLPWPGWVGVALEAKVGRLVSENPAGLGATFGVAVSLPPRVGLGVERIGAAVGKPVGNRVGDRVDKIMLEGCRVGDDGCATVLVPPAVANFWGIAVVGFSVGDNTSTIARVGLVVGETPS